MKVSSFSHHSRIITRASKDEMPRAQKLTQEINNLLFYPNDYDKGKNYHFSQKMPDFMNSKLVVKVKDDMAEFAVKIKRHWYNIPKTVTANLDLKSTDASKKTEVLGNFQTRVRDLAGKMNFKYGNDADSPVFMSW
jgi:hypothetical protein